MNRLIFASLVTMANKNIDAFLISEIKINSSFLTVQFDIEGYTTSYRLDKYGGDTLLCIKEDIPFSLFNSDVSTEDFFVDVNLGKKKWLLCCWYNPHKKQIPNNLK